MKIAILGKVNPGLTYEEWVNKLQRNFDVEKISHINITIGNGILNQYVRTYAAANDIPVTEYAADYKTHGDDARRIRNVALVEASDFIIGFLPKGSSEESWIYRPGISREKKAIVITYQSTQIDMKQVIKREPTEADLKSLHAISREDLLSVEDEVDLVKKIQDGEGDVEAAKEKLMRGNQRFVRTVAQRYVGSMFSLEELVAEGNIGLEHAIYKFDETRGFKFISYAVWWIRQSIQQAIVLKARAESELKGLSARELDIIRMYFGFGCEKASLEEIQAKYDLTPQRAMAIKNKALRKLFKSMEKLSTVRAMLMGEDERDKNED